MNRQGVNAQAQCLSPLRGWFAGRGVSLSFERGGSPPRGIVKIIPRWLSRRRFSAAVSKPTVIGKCLLYVVSIRPESTGYSTTVDFEVFGGYDYQSEEIGACVDIDSLGRGIGLFGSTFAIVKQIVDSLPNGTKKAQAIANLKRAEEEFKIAESNSAVLLGYEICRNHFPPVIMLSKDNNDWQCPECLNTKKLRDNNTDISSTRRPTR
jgi:hypothetical protein